MYAKRSDVGLRLEILKNTQNGIPNLAFSTTMRSAQRCRFPSPRSPPAREGEEQRERENPAEARSIMSPKGERQPQEASVEA